MDPTNLAVEFMRIDPDGTVTVRGEKVAQDKLVYIGFREWCKTTGMFELVANVCPHGYLSSVCSMCMSAVVAKVGKLVEDGIPRRARIDLLLPAENAIRAAVWGVEALGADPRLTEIVVDLQAVFDKLADYFEATGAA